MQNVTQESESKPKDTAGKHLFKPSSWLTKIDFINHLIQFNNALAIVLAEEGGGKTTFIELLRSSLDSQVKSEVIKAVPPFSQASLLVQLATLFHLRTDSELTISNVIQQINERKAQVLLIIDDAQHVPDAFLQEFLTELAKLGERSFFHICLVSDFSLVASLNKLEELSLGHLIHRIEPGALTESETKTYLLNSLPTPKRIDQTMTDKRLAQFYQLTGGNIARINKEMMSYFCPELKSIKVAKSSSSSKYVGLVATFAIVMLAAGYLWQNQDLFNHFTSSTPPQTAPQEITLVEQQLPSIIPKIPKSKLPRWNGKNMVSYIPGYEMFALRQDLQPPPLKRVVDIVLDDEEENENSSLVVMDKVVVIPKTIAARSISERVEEQRQEDTQTVNTERTVVSTRDVPQPLIQPSIAIKNNALAAKSTTTPEKVLEQYTVQILASQNLDDIKRFINAHQLTANTKIRTTTRKGIPWYVLTLGEFNRVEQAQQAVHNLPAKLTQYKPWIRSTNGLPAIG